MNRWYREDYNPYYLGRCRRFPWLPRWWWAMPDMPLVPQAPSPIPGYTPSPYTPPLWTEEQELAMLESNKVMVEQQLEQIKNRLKEIEK